MHGYFWVEVDMTILAFVSLILKFLLYRWDKKERGGILDSKDAYELHEEHLLKNDKNWLKRTQY